MDNSPDEMIGTIDAVRILGKYDMYVYRALASGKLQGKRIGNSYAFRRADVEALKAQLDAEERGDAGR